jgi:hypothetical protein
LVNHDDNIVESRENVTELISDYQQNQQNQEEAKE